MLLQILLTDALCFFIVSTDAVAISSFTTYAFFVWCLLNMRILIIVRAAESHKLLPSVHFLTSTTVMIDHIIIINFSSISKPLI